MRSAKLLPVLLITGCIGDRAIQPMNKTPIPGTSPTVCLYEPDDHGRYGYAVMSKEIRTHRTLGRLKADQIAPVTLKDLGNGVFRIDWGSAAYAVIDVKNAQIVEDSNSANPRNQPFKLRDS
jgi:hypothetical protein